MTSHWYLYYMPIYACEYICTHTNTMVNTPLVWTSHCCLYYTYIYVCEYIHTYIYKHHDQHPFVWTNQIIVESQKFVSAHTYLKIFETSMTIAFYLKHNKGSIFHLVSLKIFLKAQVIYQRSEKCWLGYGRLPGHRLLKD